MASVADRRVGIVFGAGGTVGMAYHAGVTRALEKIGGLQPADADLLVGTSAGSVIAAYLRSGWTGEDFWAFALGTHPTLADLDPDDMARRRREIFTPRWRSPVELTRIVVGSGYVLAQALARRPSLPIPGFLRRRFPGGLFAMTEAQRRLPDELGTAWPDRPLWLCTVDIASGRRVVLGREGAPPIPLPRAVMVLMNHDWPGNVRELENYMERAVVLASGKALTPDMLSPPGRGDRRWRPLKPQGDLAGLIRQLVRLVPTRRLARETSWARARGAEVLLIRPTAAELAVHGANLMRPDAGEEIAKAAYEATARLLTTDRFRQTLSL